MEAFAAAASIAGVITLIFQSIDGLVKCKEIFADASSASKAISGLLADINSLIQTLEDVRNVLEQFRAKKANQNFASLDIKVADCSKDIQIWLSTAKLLRPSSEQGGRAWLKKFRFAMNNNAVQKIRHEIGRHRQIISLSLTVLGRTIDLENSEQMTRISGSVSQSLSNHDIQEATLQRIENYSRASLQGSAHNISSMDSIRSELSRLESMILESRQISETEQTPNGEASFGLQASRNKAPSSGTLTGSQASAIHAGALSKGKERFDIDHDADESHWHSATTDDVEYSSSLLYASFTAPATPRRIARPYDPDCAALYSDLQRMLFEAYPACIARLVGVQRMLVLYRNQEKLLRSTSNHFSRGLSFPPLHPSGQAPRDLQRRVHELENYVKEASSVCVAEGYPMSIIEEVLGGF